MAYIVLFDIDKTLIKRSNAHFKAFLFSVKSVYNIEIEPNIIKHYGMTDQQIIKEVLKAKGLDDNYIESKIQTCIQIMIDKFFELNVNEDIELLPGVLQLLEELKRRGVLLGLVTGNVERIAWAKLKKAKIANYFKFGGFGSDNIDRKEIAKTSFKRCTEIFKLNEENDVFLFGDTPYDIEAAKAIGAVAIGVATGYPSMDELILSGADIVFENLADTSSVIKAIFNK
jgi:phosphoglycolate phosphatase-like HAD superfamily hydrolase